MEVPVFKPLIGAEEISAVVSSLEVGWLGMGKQVGEFETAISDYLGLENRFVACVSTGHAALHIALMVSGVTKGDEVIVPAFNNIADFQAILAVGATPVFCDINLKTLCIDVDQIEAHISPRTKAVIIMDYDCCLVDYERIQAIADSHNLRIIHDAAHSFGSDYKGKKVGSFSDIAMFSFDPVKTITSIDGGAIIVKSKRELELIHEYRLLGMTQPAKMMYTNARAWTYDVKRIGYRYHLSNVHAAIGLAQISKMDSISNSRREASKYYSRLLSQVPQVIVPNTNFEGICPFLYYIQVPSDLRQGLRDFLYERGIDTGIHWQAGFDFELLKKYYISEMPVTKLVASRILSLPLHSNMNFNDIDKVVEGVREFFLTESSVDESH